MRPIKQRMHNVRLVRSAVSQGWRNSVKCSHGVGETPEHRNLKWLICEKLYGWGEDFYTEATLTGGGRADIVVERWGLIIEVLHTETKGRLNDKDYPLPVLPVRVGGDFVELVRMLEELRATNGSCADFYIRRFNASQSLNII